METFQSMFAAYGLLKEIGLDKRHSVEHSRSAAYHSASDGSAGCFIQTLKRAVNKIEERTLHHGVANFLSLSRSACWKAPAELILNKQFLIKELHLIVSKQD